MSTFGRGEKTLQLCDIQVEWSQTVILSFLIYEMEQLQCPPLTDLPYGFHEIMSKPVGIPGGCTHHAYH